MKLTIISVLLLCRLALNSLTIIDASREFDLTLDDLQQLEQQEITTERERNGVMRTDSWEGVYLRKLLSVLEVKDFEQLKINSYDGYQVRITAEDITNYPALIALKRNDVEYDLDDLRLIIPGMREMFWSHAIETIRTEDLKTMPQPYFLFFAEDLLAELTLVTDPEPFRNVQGYHFSQLLNAVYSFQDAEFLLMGRDGVTHHLDYNTYLQTALLAVDENGYNLQGKDIPWGMWIKDLAYIQLIDRVIIFKGQFTNLYEVRKLLVWENLPQILSTEDQETISTEKDFSDPIWNNRGILRWPE